MFIKMLARLLHGEDRHSVFHIVALSCLVLGVFIVFTAGEMGPFAPLLISIGIYLAILSALLEGMFWAMALLRRATSGLAES